MIKSTKRIEGAIFAKIYSFFLCCMWGRFSPDFNRPNMERDSGPEVIKLFFMVNSIEHEISLGHIIKIPKNFHAQLSASSAELSMKENFVGILRFINKTNFMLSWVEHEKQFYNLEARSDCTSSFEPQHEKLSLGTSAPRQDPFQITKTRLFKYTENFTSKNWKCLD